MSESHISPDVKEVRASQIDYHLKDIDIPLYRERKIMLETYPSSQFSLDNTQKWIQWMIPSGTVFNLSRSRYSYYITQAAGAASHYTLFHLSEFTLGTDIQFVDAAGNALCDLKTADNYTKIARKLETSLDEYLTFDEFDPLRKSEKLASAVLEPADGSAGSVNYLEPLYFDATAAATKLEKYISCPLNAYKNTIFAYDKDLYFGVPMYVRINVNALNRMMWDDTSDGETAPSAGVKEVTANSATSGIKQCYLHLAVEQNPNIVKSIVDKYTNRGGLKINIPYTIAVSTSTPTEGSNNISIQVTKQSGPKLLQVLHTVWDTSRTINTAYDCDNSSAGKIESYRTSLTGNYLQDYTLSCAESANGLLNNDDWLIANQKFCKNSVIQDRKMYKKHWFHLDRFYLENQDISSDDMNIGFELPNTIVNYVVETDTGADDLTHITYLTFRRTYVISPNGIVYVNALTNAATP